MRQNIFKMSFSKVYPLYLQKAEKDFEAFFQEAPQINPAASEIKGVVCGVRVEEIQDPLMHKIRCLDKLIDELAKGKTMDKILRKKDISQ